uniref:HMG box domain-containing protein n=1 Tax=Parascaris univalens TaxID=6257 RepID=A0A915B5G3_PARUN
MTKKRRSNGFMYFAEAMRATYEAENSANQLSTKRLMERANKDWKAMNDEQREKWIAECRRRKEEYQKQVYKMQSILVTTKKKARPVSNLEQSLLPKPIPICLTEAERKALRQSVYQKLIWRENENINETLGKKKFGLLTVRPYRSFEASRGDDEIGCPPAEICLYLMSLDDGVKESHRILVSHDYPEGHCFFGALSAADHGFSSIAQTSNHLDVNRACLRIANQLRGCWSNLILVPASQYQDVAASLLWIKKKRDIAWKRDTASIRVERLICLEDMLAVIAHMLEAKVDDSPQWEQRITALTALACKLHTNAPDKCPCVVGKLACEHFLEALREIASQLNAAGDTQHPSRAGEALRTHQPVGNQSHISEVNPFQMTSIPESAYPKSVGGAFTNLHLQIPDAIQNVTNWLSSMDFASNATRDKEDLENVELHNTC